MKLTHNILAIAVLSSLSITTYAADVTIYGKANVTVQSSDDGKGSFTEVKSNASRIGVKGTHELEEGLEVVYKAEFQVDLDGDSAKGDSITDRNQYIGLRGTFGEVLLGKNDTVLKQSQGKVDLFSDLNGDIKNLWKGENRMADTVTYKSPKFSGIQLGVTYIAEDSIEADNAYSLSVAYGDTKLKKSKVFASVAMDSEVNGYDVVRATVQGKVSGVTLGAMLQTQERIDGSAEMDGLMVSAKYSVNKVTYKGQIQTANFKEGDDQSGITLGVDYALAKSTKLFAFYTNFDLDSQVDKEYLAVGIEYNF
ncbi:MULTISPECIES: porin [Colwelliaceae]|uniref:porin n=1 Tax=Colwelliaceae TaxID=267889 RepID=UPI000971075D|nr:MULTISPECIES: porin [Colwelliaceae]